MVKLSLARLPLFLHFLLMSSLLVTSARAGELPAVPVVPTEVGKAVMDAPLDLITPEEKGLGYTGRFVIDEKQAVAEWPASAVTLCFKGTDVKAKLDLGANRCEVILDGQPLKVLAASGPGSQIYDLAAGLPDAQHLITLFKCTEAGIGPMKFLGFVLNPGAKVRDIPVAERRIEVIGDSISAGFGNEAASAREPFSPTTENAFCAYGARTVRAFGADYTCIAWSGKCLWPENTLPALYDRTLPLDPTSVWKFEGGAPQVVVINLCTNDFSRGTPDEAGWVNAYHDFIAHVRKNYPDAMVYLALGSMLDDAWSPQAKPLTTARAYIQRVVKEAQAAGDARIRFVEFAPQKKEDGYGANLHPNLKTHGLMAQVLIDAIHTDLGWQPSFTNP